MSTTASEAMTGVAPIATENRWAMPGARWKGVIRPYSKEEVERLRGTVKIEYTLARLGAERLSGSCSRKRTMCRHLEQ